MNRPVIMKEILLFILTWQETVFTSVVRPTHDGFNPIFWGMCFHDTSQLDINHQCLSEFIHSSLTIIEMKEILLFLLILL